MENEGSNRKEWRYLDTLSAPLKVEEDADSDGKSATLPPQPGTSLSEIGVEYIANITAKEKSNKLSIRGAACLISALPADP